MDAVGALRLYEKGDGYRCPGNLLLVFVYPPGFTLGGRRYSFIPPAWDCFGTYNSYKPESIMARDSESDFGVN
jgi:hypothetical protein